METGLSDINELIEADPTVTSIVFAYEKKCSLNHKLTIKEGRTSHGLVYVLGGRALYKFSSEDLHVSKDDVIYLARGSKYETIGEGDTGYHFIVISFNLADDGSKSLSPLPLDIITKSANQHYYRDIFHEISEKWYYKGPLYQLKCKALLSEIIYSLAQETLKGRMHVSGLTRILPAVEYMEKCFDRDINISDISDLAGVSVSHFRRLFGRIYGISPHEYLNSIRIAKAKDMLRSEIYSVGEVAGKTGFKNIYYFSRMFRKMTGVAPSGFK